jgi:hypothetical protein
MLNAIRPLLDAGIINEDTRVAISEAWDQQINEAKEQVRAELREEFARRYDHDKSVMIQALDKMVTESLKSELAEFAADKQALTEERVQFKKSIRESTEKFNTFLVSKLTEEITELRKDRKAQEAAIAKLEAFVIESLASEIGDFAKDRQAVVEAKVRLVAEGKKKIAEMQKKFIARSAKLVQESVSKTMQTEMSQLKEDIQLARENMFGRRLFEAFAGEFALTHLNENKEIKKLRSVLAVKDRQLAESKKQQAEKSALVESKEREIRVIKESAQRKSMMNELLKPLNKEKAGIMSDLLEGVQTDKLRAAYDKYLPAVLNGSGETGATKRTLSESRSAVTGDRTAKAPVAEADSTDSNVVELKRLAGLK